jgi:hypothetical protein
VTLELSVLGSSRTELYNASGVSAAELLALRHNASFAGRLKCLDGVCDSGRHFWQLQVNGELVPYGAQEYIVKPGDSLLIEFTQK